MTRPLEMLEAEYFVYTPVNKIHFVISTKPCIARRAERRRFRLAKEQAMTHQVRLLEQLLHSM